MDPITILIADDDVQMLTALKVRLESEGYNVVVTQDAYQALDKAQRLAPSLLLLDINMPAGNGFSVHERLATMDKLSGTQVIYITGESPGMVDATANDLGAFAVIHKPFKTEKLLDTIRAAIGTSVASA